jgi:hypothetical protein
LQICSSLLVLALRRRARGCAVAQVCHLTGKRAGATCSPGVDDACLTCSNVCGSSCIPAGKLLPRSGLPRPPPPVRGRCGESDGRLFLIDGGGEGSSLVCAVLQFGSWNESCSSTLVTAGDCHPTIKAILRPYQKPVMDSGNCSASKVRPFLRSVSAHNVLSVTSGFVPVPVLDDGSFDLQLNRRWRKRRTGLHFPISQRVLFYIN